VPGGEKWKWGWRSGGQGGPRAHLDVHVVELVLAFAHDPAHRDQLDEAPSLDVFHVGVHHLHTAESVLGGEHRLPLGLQGAPSPAKHASPEQRSVAPAEAARCVQIHRG